MDLTQLTATELIELYRTGQVSPVEAMQQTLDRVENAYRFVRDLVANGGSVLFIGTAGAIYAAAVDGAGAGARTFTTIWLVMAAVAAAGVVLAARISRPTAD